MVRLSWRKLLLPMQVAEFAHAVTRLAEAMEAEVGDVVVSIEMFSSLPMTSSFMHDDDVMDWMAEENRKKVFLKLDTPTDPELVTAWADAVYVQCTVHPRGAEPSNYTFGSIEAKGRYHKGLTFYIQSMTGDESCARMREKLLRERPFYCLTGDGYRPDHT